MTNYDHDDKFICLFWLMTMFSTIISMSFVLSVFTLLSDWLMAIWWSIYVHNNDDGSSLNYFQPDWAFLSFQSNPLSFLKISELFVKDSKRLFEILNRKKDSISLHSLCYWAFRRNQYNFIDNPDVQSSLSSLKAFFHCLSLYLIHDHYLLWSSASSSL